MGGFSLYSSDPKMEKLQKVTLKMAQEIVDFCQKNQLLCYFCGGGAIGAVREGGFIPWDDDLDFFMPREDYERFYVLWSQSKNIERYPIQKASRDYNDHNSFTTIRDNQTTFVKTYQKDLDIVHGITIDIFPLDVAPDSTFSRKIQKMWALVYALFCSQVVPENHGGIMASGSRILLNIFRSSHARYKIWSFAEKRMTKYNKKPTKYVTELCVGPKYMGNIYYAEDFAEAIFKPFEEAKMPIPIGYDRYLKSAFGDYMKRPAKEDQKTIHEAVFIDPEHPYEQYKGKYYLNKGADKS
ncbi:LICD family protein [Enterococcus faecalis 13-SD-W-01]|nr:LICD family protein [Enterococcus faecalis 13-SD-W-01]